MPNDTRPMHFEQYDIPRSEFIGRGPTTEELYKLESRATEAICAAAEELSRLAQIPEADYYRRALPRALWTMLDAFDARAGVAAAIGYIRHHHPEILAPDWQ